MKQELTVCPGRFLGSPFCPTLPFQLFWVEEFPIWKEGLSIQWRCEEVQRYQLMLENISLGTFNISKVYTLGGITSCCLISPSFGPFAHFVFQGLRCALCDGYISLKRLDSKKRGVTQALILVISLHFS